MNIALSIKTLKGKIVAAINESQLPPSIVEPVMNAIYLQIAQAARQELEKAEKEDENNA